MSNIIIDLHNSDRALLSSLSEQYDAIVEQRNCPDIDLLMKEHIKEGYDGFIFVTKETNRLQKFFEKKYKNVDVAICDGENVHLREADTAAAAPQGNVAAAGQTTTQQTTVNNAQPQQPAQDQNNQQQQAQQFNGKIYGLINFPYPKLTSKCIMEILSKTNEVCNKAKALSKSLNDKTTPVLWGFPLTIDDLNSFAKALKINEIKVDKEIYIIPERPDVVASLQGKTSHKDYQIVKHKNGPIVYSGNFDKNEAENFINKINKIYAEAEKSKAVDQKKFAQKKDEISKTFEGISDRQVEVAVKYIKVSYQSIQQYDKISRSAKIADNIKLTDVLKTIKEGIVGDAFDDLDKSIEQNTLIGTVWQTAALVKDLKDKYGDKLKKDETQGVNSVSSETLPFLMVGKDFADFCKEIFGIK